MRVCLISREFPPETGWGGMGTFMYDLALGLSELGNEVEVISLSGGRSSSVSREQQVTVHRVPPVQQLDKLEQFLTVMPYSHSILKQLCALYEKFYELHSQRPFDVIEVPEMFAEGIFIGSNKIAPLLVRLHTPHFKFIDEGLHLIVDTFDHQFLAMAEQLAIMQADIVASPSEDLAQYVSNRTGYPLSAIPIIRNHVDTKRFTPDGSRWLKNESGHVPVLFVGRLEERKGVHVLAAAIPNIVQRFPNVHFYLAGKDTNTAYGGTSVQQHLTRELKKSGCLDRVTLIGPVARDDMPALYRSAQICVLPSLYENAPITCIEAMASGLVVVASSAGGTKEYIVDGKTGVLVPPGDPAALADQTVMLLGNEERRRSIALAARETAVALYDRREIARQSLELYERACARFIARRDFAIIKTDPKDQLQSFYKLAGQFEQMIFHHVYCSSFIARVKYWAHMIKARPKFGTATLILTATSRTAHKLNLSNVQISCERLKDRLGGIAPAKPNIGVKQ